MTRNTYTPTPSKSHAGTVPALKALPWKINPTFAFMPSPSFPPALLFVVVWPPNSDHFQTQVGWHLIRSENSWVTRSRLKSREFGRRAPPGTNRRSIRDSIEFYAKPYR
jgi:hypothetical protein